MLHNWNTGLYKAGFFHAKTEADLQEYHEGKKGAICQKSHSSHCRTMLNLSLDYKLILFLALCLHQFFNQVLMLGKTSVSDLSEHVFDLILELYNIDSHLLLSVLPQLEFKLKVTKKEKNT